MGLGAPKVIQDQDFRDINVDRQMPVGTYGETPDGRGYRYAKAGASTLDPGKLVVAATVDSDATNIVVSAAAAVGATQVTATTAGAITASLYQDGYMTVNDATGEGISYLVKNNTGTSGAAVTTIDLLSPIKVALVASTSEISLTQNPWHSVVISVTDQADMAVGVPNVSITNAYYGWVQTRGVCAVWADEAITAGQAVTTGTGTAGQVEALDAAGEPQIGVAIVAAVDTEYREIYLTID